MPFLSGEDRFDYGRQDGLDGVGVDSLYDAQSGGLGSVLDWDHLITDGGEHGRKEDDEVWLSGGRGLGVFSDSLDGIESALSCCGILLVGELLLEGFDSPEGKILADCFEAKSKGEKIATVNPNEPNFKNETKRVTLKQKVPSVDPQMSLIMKIVYTYFNGANSSFEFTKTEMLWVAELMSACSLLRLSLANSSSKTLTEPLFSFEADMFAVLVDASVSAGMLEGKSR